MIEISEKVVVNSLRAGLKLLRDNPELFDRIFPALNTEERHKIKQYLTNDTVKVTYGYPVNRASLPCFALMLGGENESEQNLGDYVDSIDDDVVDYGFAEGTDETIREERLRVRRQGEMITFTTTRKNIRAITAIHDEDGNMLDLGGLEVLDARKGEVALYGTDVINNEEVDVSYVYQSIGLVSYGAVFDKQYRIEVWATNGDLASHLYHVLKWLMMFSRPRFYEAGWLDVSLGGADLEPIAGFDGETAYRRAMSLTFKLEETYELEEAYIQQIEVNYQQEGGSADD